MSLFLAFFSSTFNNSIYRADKEEHRADVVDEGAERSKHFDEELGSGRRSQGTLVGSSKTGDSCKRDPATSGIREKQENYNKNIGKDALEKKS